MSRNILLDNSHEDKEADNPQSTYRAQKGWTGKRNPYFVQEANNRVKLYVNAIFAYMLNDSVHKQQICSRSHFMPFDICPHATLVTKMRNKKREVVKKIERKSESERERERNRKIRGKRDKEQI